MKPKRDKRKLQVDAQVIRSLTPAQNQEVVGGARGTVDPIDTIVHENGVKVSRCCL